MCKFELYNEDCLRIMGRLQDKSIDLVITDPPYGVEYSKGFDDSKEHVEENIGNWLSEIHRLLKEGSHCYIFIPSKEVDLWVKGVKEVGLVLMNILATRTYTSSVYLKSNFSFNNQLILYCSKGKAKDFNKVDFIPTSESWLKDKRNKNPKPYTYSYPSFLPYFSNEKSTGKRVREGRHPCAKNIDFIEFLVKLSSNEGQVVFDPFTGGGSTGIASVRAGRDFIGSELNEEYYKLAKVKLDRELKELDKKLNLG